MKIHFVGDLNSSKNKASNGYEITDKYVAYSMSNSNQL